MFFLGELLLLKDTECELPTTALKPKGKATVEAEYSIGKIRQLSHQPS